MVAIGRVRYRGEQRRPEARSGGTKATSNIGAFDRNAENSIEQGHRLSCRHNSEVTHKRRIRENRKPKITRYRREVSDGPFAIRLLYGSDLPSTHAQPLFSLQHPNTVRSLARPQTLLGSMNRSPLLPSGLLPLGWSPLFSPAWADLEDG